MFQSISKRNFFFLAYPLYGDFGLFIFGIFAFCFICILLHLYFVSFAFCYYCIMSNLHFVTFAICSICILSGLHCVWFAFCLFLTFCYICILSNLHFVTDSLGVPIENQCVKGGGMLYVGFGLFTFGISAFCLIFILSHLHFVTFVFCLIFVLLHLHYVLFAFCYICDLSHLHLVRFVFCLVWRFVTFAFCHNHNLILSRTINHSLVQLSSSLLQFTFVCTNAIDNILYTTAIHNFCMHCCIWWLFYLIEWQILLHYCRLKIFYELLQLASFVVYSIMMVILCGHYCTWQLQFGLLQLKPFLCTITMNNFLCATLSNSYELLKFPTTDNIVHPRSPLSLICQPDKWLGLA